MFYKNISTYLDQADENKIFELTGCLSTCDKYEYAVQPYTSLNKMKHNQSQMEEPNALGLKFYFLTGKHEVKEQVIFKIDITSLYVFIHFLLLQVHNLRLQ